MNGKIRRKIDNDGSIRLHEAVSDSVYVRAASAAAKNVGNIKTGDVPAGSLTDFVNDMTTARRVSVLQVSDCHVGAKSNDTAAITLMKRVLAGDSTLSSLLSDDDVAGVNSGDLTYSSVSTVNQYAGIINIMADWNNDRDVTYRFNGRPILNIKGNHDAVDTDVATSAGKTEAQHESDCNDTFLYPVNDGFVTWGGAGKGYWHRDFVRHGVRLRLIALDEYQHSVGTPTAGPNNNEEYSKVYSQAQMEWLVATLKSTPSDAYVIMCHHQPLYATHPDTSMNDFVHHGKVGGVYQTGKTFSYTMFTYREGNIDLPARVVDAYLHKRNVSFTVSPNGVDGSTLTFNADFRDATPAKFACHINGHVHGDYCEYHPAFPEQLCLTIATANYGVSTNYQDVTRSSSGENSYLLNRVTIDADRDVVIVDRIGAGTLKSDGWVTQDGSGRHHIEFAIPQIVAKPDELNDLQTQITENEQAVSDLDEVICGELFDGGDAPTQSVKNWSFTDGAIKRTTVTNDYITNLVDDTNANFGMTAKIPVAGNTGLTYTGRTFYDVFFVWYNANDELIAATLQLRGTGVLETKTIAQITDGNLQRPVGDNSDPHKAFSDVLVFNYMPTGATSVQCVAATHNTDTAPLVRRPRIPAGGAISDLQNDVADLQGDVADLASQLTIVEYETPESVEEDIARYIPYKSSPDGALSSSDDPLNSSFNSTLYGVTAGDKLRLQWHATSGYSHLYAFYTGESWSSLGSFVAASTFKVSDANDSPDHTHVAIDITVPSGAKSMLVVDLKSGGWHTLQRKITMTVAEALDRTEQTLSRINAGKMAVSWDGTDLLIAYNDGNGTEYCYWFCKCMANELFTFHKVGVRTVTRSYASVSGIKSGDGITELNVAGSDNIGPIEISDNGTHFVGGNHLGTDAGSGTHRTAVTSDVMVTVDGQLLADDGEIVYCDCVGVHVSNKIYRAGGNRDFADTEGNYAVNEIVHYTVKGASIGVNLKHAYVQSLNVTKYYGMQSNFAGETHFAFNNDNSAGLGGWKAASLSEFNYAVASDRCFLFVEKRADDWCQGTYLANTVYPESAANQPPQRSFIHSGSKHYHVIMYSAGTITAGSALVWRGIYTWFKANDDDTVVSYGVDLPGAERKVVLFVTDGVAPVCDFDWYGATSEKQSYGLTYDGSGEIVGLTGQAIVLKH